MSLTFVLSVIYYSKHIKEEICIMKQITKKHAVMMEYVIIAVLIAAAVVVAK